jgi:hypothetical protein
MKAETRIVEPEETAIARQLDGKHLSVVMNAHTTVEKLLGHC